MESDCMYIDDLGFTNANPQVFPPVICTFLECDVQGFTDESDKLLDNLQKAMTDPNHTYGWGGNAHTCKISHTGMHVKCVYSKSLVPVTLPLQEAIDIIKEWKSFIEKIRAEKKSQQ